MAVVGRCFAAGIEVASPIAGRLVVVAVVPAACFVPFVQAHLADLVPAAGIHSDTAEVRVNCVRQSPALHQIVAAAAAAAVAAAAEMSDLAVHLRVAAAEPEPERLVPALVLVLEPWLGLGRLRSLWLSTS